MQSGRTIRTVSHQRPSPRSPALVRRKWHRDSSKWMLVILIGCTCGAVILAIQSSRAAGPLTRRSREPRRAQRTASAKRRQGGPTHYLGTFKCTKYICWARLQDWWEQSGHHYSTSSFPALYCMTYLFLSASTLKPILTLVCHRIYASDGASFASSYVPRHSQVGTVHCNSFNGCGRSVRSTSVLKCLH